MKNGNQRTKIFANEYIQINTLDKYIIRLQIFKANCVSLRPKNSIFTLPTNILNLINYVKIKRVFEIEYINLKFNILLIIQEI